MKRKAGRNPDTGRRTYYSDQQGAPVFQNKTENQIPKSQENRYVSWGERLKRALGRNPETDRVTDVYSDNKDRLEEIGQELTGGGENKG